MNIYCIPGLANDRRIFDNLSPLLNGNIIYLEHLGPIKDESLKDYAIRLSSKVDNPSESILIGFSLGGMIAVELNKIHKFKKMFLISTVKHPFEFPPLIKIARKYFVDNNLIIPSWLIKNNVKFITKLLNTTDYFGREHLHKQISKSTDDHILWAQKAVLQWDNKLIPDNYIHIHGTKDEIFPLGNIRATHYIQGGNHYMIMDKSEEVAKIINGNI